MRLFVKVDLPESILSYLDTIAKRFKTNAADVATAKERHITLKFLGEVPENKVEDIERRLSRVLFKPFQARLGVVGTFGEGRDIRVVWGSVEPVDAWRKLAKEVDRNLSEFKNDYNVFTPHITFVRVKRMIAAEGFKELVQNTKLDTRLFEVNKFTLMQSIPGFEGHRYKVIRTYEAQNYE